VTEELARRRRRRNLAKAILFSATGRRPCPLCGGRARPAGSSPLHAHLRCTSCGLVYVADLPSREDLVASYARVHESDYQVSHKLDWAPFLDHKRRTLEALAVPRGEARADRPRALDVGCGEGVLLGLLEEWGYAPLGLELNAVLAGRARAHLGPGAVVLAAPFEECAPLVAPHLPLDLVVMNHLLEHLREPLAALALARSLLAPTGLLLVETPTRPDFENIDHLYCFGAAALDLALRASGLLPARWFDYVDDNYGHHNLACLARV
jgi:SAM-dependent methyltransferase